MFSQSTCQLLRKRRAEEAKTHRAGEPFFFSADTHFSTAAHSDAASQPRPSASAAPGCAAAGLAGRGGTGTEEGHQDPVLPGPAGGDPGADVRAPLGGSDERFPPRPAAGAARQTQPDLPDHRADPDRQEDPPPAQPAQHLPLGVQVSAGGALKES